MKKIFEKNLSERMKWRICILGFQRNLSIYMEDVLCWVGLGKSIGLKENEPAV